MNPKLYGPSLALYIIRKNFFPSFFRVTSQNCQLYRSYGGSKIIPTSSFTLQCKTKQVCNIAPFRRQVLHSDGFLIAAKVFYGSNNTIQTDSSSSGEPKKDEPQKLSIFKKFKAMYRDYWYVLVPVHIVTSAVWFGSFYYMASSGVDIAALAEMVHLDEDVVEKIRKNSNTLAGHLAVSYLLYKVFTPLRYTITVGGTTISINYLKKWGYIKPIIKKEEFKKLLEEKKVSFRKKRDKFRARKDLMKRNVIEKLTQKKRTKNTADLIRKILQNRKINDKNGTETISKMK